MESGTYLVIIYICGNNDNIIINSVICDRISYIRDSIGDNKYYGIIVVL